jgi:hypothetical protein
MAGIAEAVVGAHNRRVAIENAQKSLLKRRFCPA